MSCLAETALAKAMNCNKHLGKLQLTIIMAIFDPEFLLNIRHSAPDFAIFSA